jgi:hypothetical protein
MARACSSALRLYLKPVDTTIVDFEVAKLDIWNYKDDYLQSQQLKPYRAICAVATLAVVHPASGQNVSVR